MLNSTRLNPGGEQCESYYSVIRKRQLIQYDYRAPDGVLFSCIAPDIETARARRDKWLNSANRLPAYERV